jgi:quercetin dioxygenase-like cupin family protein
VPSPGDELLNPHTGQTIRFVEIGDDLLVMESSYRAGGMPAPPHLHPAQDEHFEVLAGAVRATVDGEARTLEEGDTLDVPAGTVHDFGGDPERDGTVRWEVRPALNTAAFFETTFGLASGEIELPEGGAEELLARFEGEFRLA